MLLRSCSTSSQWQSVISLQPLSRQRNCKMDRQSFSLVLDVCKALGRWQQALKIVKASEGSGSKVSRVHWLDGWQAYKLIYLYIYMYSYVASSKRICATSWPWISTLIYTHIIICIRMRNLAVSREAFVYFIYKLLMAVISILLPFFFRAQILAHIENPTTSCRLIQWVTRPTRPIPTRNSFDSKGAKSADCCSLERRSLC